MQNLDYELRCDNLVTPQDCNGGVATNANMWRSMAKYRKGLVVIIAALTDTKTCIAQLRCATNAAGDDAEDVTNFAVTLTGAAATTLNQVDQIEFDVSDLLAISATKPFVGVTLTGNQASDLQGATLIRGAARWYKGASMPV